MAAIPPPQGMNEADYDTIEAAVTETVRGRWFLNEFGRRNRLAETRQLLEAMARLESAVANSAPTLPSADPSIRLLIQRIKEIAGQLGVVAADMREGGIEDRYVEAIEREARAVAGMMRSPSNGRIEPPPGDAGLKPDVESRQIDREGSQQARSLDPPMAEPAVPAIRTLGSQTMHDRQVQTVDPRLAVLSGLDRMSAAEKLALFV